MLPSSPPAAASPQEQRQALGRAARLLASASDFGDTLRQTLAACLPTVADFGFFDVVVADGVRRTVAAHQAPHVEDLLAGTRWVRQLHPELNLCALSTGEPALHPAIDDDWYRRVATGEAHLRLLRELAFRSMITVPVRYRDELVGALTLFMAASGRRHTEDDVAFAADLALLAAPIVVNARLVEQHEQAEAALRVSEERLRMATEAGQVGIWDWDIATSAVTWSERIYRMHGREPGTDTGGLDGFRTLVHPEDLPKVEAAIASALAGGPPYEVEFRSPLPDGRVRWIATRSQLVRDAGGQPRRMVGASIDVTERTELLAAERRARADAEAARRRLELLWAASSALANSLDTEDTLGAIATAVVPGIADFCRIDLLDADGVLQRRVAHHADPEVAQRALEMARRMQARPTTIGSMRWCVDNGLSHYGRFDEPPASEDEALRAYTGTFGMRSHFIVPLVARGHTLGAMGVVQAESGRDLTPEDRELIQDLARRAALALDNARAYAEAEAARREAEAASRAKDEFLAMLGHELRNPLAPITTALELMARREPTLLQEERRIIGRQVSHLSRLIDDLLDVSRITQGKIELQREPLDLRVIVAHALEQTQPLLGKRPEPVAVRLPPGPAPVHGDAVRLTQVLCNLLINAGKFTPPTGRIALELAREGEWLELAVQDAGRGIAPELLPQVFDLFVQGRQSLAREPGGLGLGLAIVRMLVEMHGGTVRAESAGEGQGSRFVVRLPASQASVAANDDRVPREAPARSGARILIVDDNRDAAETLGELLQLMGYDVRSAGDAESALGLLEGFRPQLALLDIGLPGMDGYQLAARLRANAALQGLRLVALTGYGTEGDRARALKSEFDEHLVKPVPPERLLQTLGRLLR